MSNQCKHGQLARQCEIYELESRVAELYNALDMMFERLLVDNVGLDGDEIDQVHSALDSQQKRGGSCD